MKKFLLPLAFLFLTACIPVDDFGGYWDKGVIEKPLLGQWDEAPKKTARTHGRGAKPVAITEQGGAYRIDSLDPEERAKKDYAPVIAKTLQAGPYTYLMVRDDNRKKGGDLVRYVLDGNLFTEYSLTPSTAGPFIKKHFPKVKNIGRPKCESRCLYDEIRVHKLDDDAVKVLGAIPDSKIYWSEAGQYKRHSGLNP